MMTTLFTAIKARFDSDAGHALHSIATGGMWLGYAPQGTACPYITLTAPGAMAPDLYLGASGTPTQEQNQPITFSIWDDQLNPDRADTIAVALRALYDCATLTLATGHTMIMALPLGQYLVPEPDDKGWAIHVDYRYSYT